MKNYFGIDIGGTAVKWAILNEEFHIVTRGSLPTAFETADELVAVLADLVRPHLDRVEAVGVSVPGGIYEDDPDGTIHRGGALLYMDGCPLGRRLREELGLPVAVNNDGKCCALGEYAAGALRGTKCGVVLAIGTGIGGGIVIDGRVLRGAHCFAGEFSSCETTSARVPTWGSICFLAPAAGEASATWSPPRKASSLTTPSMGTGSSSGSRPATRRRCGRFPAMLGPSTPRSLTFSA